MKRLRIKGEVLSGFTLIEVMMLIVLTGILITPLLSPFFNSVLKGGQPELAATAAFLAAEQLEQLQTTTYGCIANVAKASLTGNYTAFSRQVAVTLVNANLTTSATDVGYKKVVVTVYKSSLPAAGISITSVFTY